jgi:hypothetical protein
MSGSSLALQGKQLADWFGRPRGRDGEDVEAQAVSREHDAAVRRKG